MTLDRLGARFPKGEAVLREALRREGVRPERVDLRLAYTGVSWTLHVTCPEVNYRRVAQLAPEDLRADTAWGELCDSIGEDVARALAQAGSADDASAGRRPSRP